MGVIPVLIVIALWVLMYTFRALEAVDLTIISLVLASFLTLTIVISLPNERMVRKAWIQQYYAVEQTLSESRINISELERATLIRNTIEINKELANMKYWNGTIFDYWIPDEVMKLKPLK